MIELLKYIACIAGGVGIGYFAAHMVLEKRFEELLDENTREAKEFYRNKYDKDTQEHAKVVEAASEALSEYKGEFPREVEVDTGVESDEDDEDDEDEFDRVLAEATGETEPEPYPKLAPPVVIPDQPSGKTNYNAMSGKKTAAEKDQEYAPSVISEKEFNENRSEFTQRLVTYFAEDGIFANESDQVITNEAAVAILGLDAVKMLRAGPEAMRGAENIYVRNTKVLKEFQIAYHPESYSSIVGPIVDAAG